MANQIQRPLLVLRPGLLGAGGRLGHISLFLEMSRLSSLAPHRENNFKPLHEFIDELDLDDNQPSKSSETMVQNSEFTAEQQYEPIAEDQDNIEADQNGRIISPDSDLVATAKPHATVTEKADLSETNGPESKTEYPLRCVDEAEVAVASNKSAPTISKEKVESGKYPDLPGYAFNKNTLKLFDTFTKLGIEYHTEVYHEKPDRLSADPLFLYCKNLFLKDRKGQFYLYICHENIDVDLKLLRKEVKAHRNFNFGTADDLESILGVMPGGVTPLALMNGTAKHVRIVISNSLVKEGTSLMFHPLDSNLATRISLFSLLRFLKHFDHAVEFVS